MLRFVILEHDHPVRHWDLMLEMGDVLRTWRLEQPPTAGNSIAAEAWFDHRLIYLDYEGPISGGRGNVVRWDFGTYDMDGPTESALEFLVTGRRLVGKVVLWQEVADRWAFRFEPTSL